MYKYFDESMTTREATCAYFKATDKQPEDVIEKVREEYREIYPILSHRESELVKEGWLTD